MCPTLPLSFPYQLPHTLGGSCFGKQQEAVYLVWSGGHAVYQTLCVGGRLLRSLLNWWHQALRCTAADEVAEQSLHDNVQEAQKKKKEQKQKTSDGKMNVADYAKVKMNIMDSEINTYNSPSLPRQFSILPPSVSLVSSMKEQLLT